MFTLIMTAWLFMGTLSCMVASVWGLLYNVSLIIALSIVDCQALVQLALTHHWFWIHEWKSWNLRFVCIFVVTSLLILTMGPDFYKVRLITRKE